MATDVQWGILGNATIARKCVIGAIQRSRNGRLRALASRSPEEASKIVRRHDIQVLYEEYDALLADAAITAVYIPLPNHLHRSWTLKALAAGKHVLCEKPMACNTQEAQEMARAAEASQRLLMEAFMYRFHPRSRRIKAMVDAGEIGSLRFVRAAFTYAMDANRLKQGDNARLRPEMGGGALLDVGCYGVSVARWMMNDEPRHVQAQASFHPSGADWHLVGMLDFGHSRMAVVEASFVSALQQTFSVVGTHGAIELPHNAFIPWDRQAVFTLRKRDEENGTPYRIAGTDEYQLMVEHFADAVLGQAPLAYSPAESIANLRVLDALKKAAQKQCHVALETE